MNVHSIKRIFENSLIRKGVVSLLVVIILLGMFASFNIVFAYEVKYEGDFVGYVSDKDTVIETEVALNDKVETIATPIDSSNIESDLVLTVSDEIQTPDEVSDKIIEASENFVDGYGLYIDEELVLTSINEKDINNVFATIKKEIEEKYKAKSVTFSFDYKITSGTYVSDDCKTLEEIKEIIQSSDWLTYEIIVEKTTDETIEFQTETIEDSSYPEGYTFVQCEGTNGSQRVISEIKYNQTKKLSEKVIKTTVLEEVQNKVTIIGTGRINSISGNEEYLIPVGNPGSRWVSSEFGPRDGRMHYGIDIAAPTGTPLYASKAGKVTDVSYETGGYGNYFIIDHLDGTQTLYAHCESIFVSVGDVVEKGAHTASVGSTGRSTGPHLHFEIRINGEKVNPALYLNTNKI